MPSISIRSAASEDEEAILTLWRALLDEQATLEGCLVAADDAAERWRNDFPEWVRDASRFLVVAERGEQIVGFLSAERWIPPPMFDATHEVYINEVYIQPEVRSMGVGRRLVKAVKEWAREIEAARLRLGVLIANETGRAFWHTLGAKPLSQTLTIDVDTASQEAGSGDKNPIGF